MMAAWGYFFDTPTQDRPTSLNAVQHVDGITVKGIQSLFAMEGRPCTNPRLQTVMSNLSLGPFLPFKTLADMGLDLSSLHYTHASCTRDHTLRSHQTIASQSM